MASVDAGAVIYSAPMKVALYDVKGLVLLRHGSGEEEDAPHRDAILIGTAS